MKLLGGGDSHRVNFASVTQQTLDLEMNELLERVNQEDNSEAIPLSSYTVPPTQQLPLHSQGQQISSGHSKKEIDS